MKYILSCATDKGPKNENQDNLAIWQEGLLVRKRMGVVGVADESMPFCLAVADGVTATKQASLASKLAIDCLTRLELNADPLEIITLGMNKANQVVSELDQQGACTLDFVIVKDDQCFYGNIGDSPIYLIRHQQIKQLAQMHTAAMMKMKLGMDDDISEHDEHVLTNYVGNEYVKGEAQMYTSSLKLESGDYLLICSDGVSGALGEDGILALVQEEHDAITLIKEAKKQAKDNISAIVLQVE